MSVETDAIRRIAESVREDAQFMKDTLDQWVQRESLFVIPS